MKRTLPQLLSKKMTRREFLGIVGLALITVLGINSMLKNVAGLTTGRKIKSRALTKRVFGSGAYGI
jgi:hypothetical protein